MNLSSELQIETPEGIRFSYALAGPVTRCLAWMLDLVAVVVLMLFALKLIFLFSLLSPDLGTGLGFVLYFVVTIGYGVLTEWFWRGQTIGKRCLRLRVMDVEGMRLRFHQVLMRNLLRAVDCLPGLYFVGGLCTVFSRRLQRLGDLAAGTVVVHHARSVTPDLEQLLAGGKFNSLRAVPHLAARLRQEISPEAARLALQALLRRDEIEAAARVALFQQLAAYFRGLVAFPEEIAEVLSDEQYVRNVVDVLFRAQEHRRAV